MNHNPPYRRDTAPVGGQSFTRCRLPWRAGAVNLPLTPITRFALPPSWVKFADLILSSPQGHWTGLHDPRHPGGQRLEAPCWAQAGDTFTVQSPGLARERRRAAGRHTGRSSHDMEVNVLRFFCALQR